MKRAKMRWFYKLNTGLIRLLAHIVFGIKVTGLENVPLEGPILLVGNHMSNLDPPLIGSFVPREAHFAAKIQLFDGLLGHWMRYHNAIPVRRSGSDKDAIKSMVAKLKEGNAVMIFPEGTRTLSPEGQQAKAGVGMIAAMAKTGLLPIRIDGSHDPKTCMKKRGTMRITFGKPISMVSVLENAPSRKEAYRQVADTVMEKIRSMGVENGVIKAK